MAPTTPRSNKITWIDDKTTSGVLDGCIAVERRRSSFTYDESVIIRAMQQTQCMGSREIDSKHYGSINRSQTLLLSLNSTLGFCSALELVDVVFSDYHRRANLLMYNNNNWRVV